jgi:CspA family cold shock protein
LDGCWIVDPALLACASARGQLNHPLLARLREGGRADRLQQRKKSMATGTVKWFNDAKGFGFITQDNGGEDVFCHHTAISAEGFRTLAEGQKVSFDVAKGPKGLQAQNVKPV